MSTGSDKSVATDGVIGPGREESGVLDALLNHSPFILFATDSRGVLTFCRGEGLAALGFTQHELVGKSVFDIAPGWPEIAENLDRAFLGERVKFTATFAELCLEFSLSPVTDAEGQVVSVAGLATDISEWVQLENELRRRALYDDVTGLPNRNLLIDTLEAAIKQQSSRSFVLVTAGIKRFREINSTFGFHYGDLLLKQIGRNLVTHFPNGSVVTRIGGDEFAVMMPAENAEEGALFAAKNAVAIFEIPYYIEQNAIVLEASIGLALYPNHGDNADMLLRRASSAMHVAKRSGADYSFYTPSRDDARINNVALLAELQQALEGNHLFLMYQPKIDLSNGELVGAEALLRWEHPNRGLIPPAAFIPLAERSGIIRPLTQWVAHTAARQVAEWRDIGINIPVAINLSSRSFQFAGLIGQLQSVLDDWDIEGELLELEITETAVMTDPERAVGICRQARGMGMALAIDDFGVGHSPLFYLKKLDVTHIKIDQSFIKDIEDHPDNLTIVRSIVDMGKKLGLLTVAEGIEDDNTYQRLAALGCDHGQGYFIARPMPSNDFMAWLQKRATDYPTVIATMEQT